MTVQTAEAILQILDGDLAGDLDAGDIAGLLRIEKGEVQKALHSLTRSGRLLPRKYRLFPHERATARIFCSASSGRLWGGLLGL
jgi:hypothetical protein